LYTNPLGAVTASTLSNALTHASSHNSLVTCSSGNESARAIDAHIVIAIAVADNTAPIFITALDARASSPSSRAVARTHVAVARRIGIRVTDDATARGARTVVVVVVVADDAVDDNIIHALCIARTSSSSSSRSSSTRARVSTAQRRSTTSSIDSIDRARRVGVYVIRQNGP
jgi:hypothetical protein